MDGLLFGRSSNYPSFRKNVTELIILLELTLFLWYLNQKQIQLQKDIKTGNSKLWLLHGSDLFWIRRIYRDFWFVLIYLCISPEDTHSYIHKIVFRITWRPYSNENQTSPAICTANHECVYYVHIHTNSQTLRSFLFTAKMKNSLTLKDNLNQFT